MLKEDFYKLEFVTVAVILDRDKGTYDKHSAKGKFNLFNKDGALLIDAVLDDENSQVIELIKKSRDVNKETILDIEMTEVRLIDDEGLTLHGLELDMDTEYSIKGMLIGALVNEFDNYMNLK